MPGRLVFGFEAYEGARARRASEYDTPHRVAEFPLIEWGWGRIDNQRYIEQITGVRNWPKSACDFCPFALTNRAGREATLVRFMENPESARRSMMIERRAISLNPRAGLIAGKRLADLIAAEIPWIAESFQEALSTTPHSAYEVRRLWRAHASNPKKANAHRALRVLASGTREQCAAIVAERGEVEIGDDGIERVLPAQRRLPAGARALPGGRTRRRQ